MWDIFRKTVKGEAQEIRSGQLTLSDTDIDFYVKVILIYY